MKLITKEIEKKLEQSPLYSQEKNDNPEIVVKFFTPDAQWTWFVIEGEKRPDGDWLFFGYVVGLESELGYFTLSQLQEVRGPYGYPIERDMYFDGKHLNDVRN